MKKKPATKKPSEAKVLRHMREQDRNNTRAFWATSNVRASANAYFIAYADHAQKALDASQTLPPGDLFAPANFNLIEEARRNKELHASMDFMRILLKEHHKSPAKDNIVEPKVAITPPK